MGGQTLLNGIDSGVVPPAYAINRLYKYSNRASFTHNVSGGGGRWISIHGKAGKALYMTFSVI